MWTLWQAVGVDKGERFERQHFGNEFPTSICMNIKTVKLRKPDSANRHALKSLKEPEGGCTLPFYLNRSYHLSFTYLLYFTLRGVQSHPLRSRRVLA
jgi:hypothetical protein